MHKNDRMKEHLGDVGNILLLVGPQKRDTKTSGKMGEDICICIIPFPRQAEINKRTQTKGRMKRRNGCNLCYSLGDCTEGVFIFLLVETSERSVRTARSPSVASFVTDPLLVTISPVHDHQVPHPSHTKRFLLLPGFPSATGNMRCCWETSF